MFQQIQEFLKNNNKITSTDCEKIFIDKLLQLLKNTERHHQISNLKKTSFVWLCCCNFIQYCFSKIKRQINYYEKLKSIEKYGKV